MWRMLPKIDKGGEHTYALQTNQTLSKFERLQRQHKTTSRLDME